MSVTMANRHDAPLHGRREYNQQSSDFDQSFARDTSFAHDNGATFLSAPMTYEQNTANNLMYATSNAANSSTYLAPQQTWSPSTVSEHISPQAFSTGDAYSDITQHSSPANNLEQFPDLQFAPLPGTQDLAGGLGFVNQMQHLPAHSAATLDYLPAQPLGTTGPSPASQHLSPPHLSPEMTAMMSPESNLSSAYYMPSRQGSHHENETYAAAMATMQMPTLDIPQSQMQTYSVPSNVPSPIVRIENYSRNDSPQGATPMSPSLSKRGGHGSRKSSVHLSPYPDDSSDEEDGPQDRGQNRAGLAPQQRDRDAIVPSIDEIHEQNLKAEKNAEVEDWLTYSEISSLADDERSSRKQRDLRGRQRAKSTNDAARPGMGRYDDSRIPGPGIYIDEKSEAEEPDDDDEPTSPVADPYSNARDSDDSYSPPMRDDDAEVASIKARPWADTPSELQDAKGRIQPSTANAAMMRMAEKAKEFDRASVSATIGSRRNRSDTDLSSLFSATGISQRAPSIADNDIQKNSKDNRPRRTSLLDYVTGRRPAGGSGLLKRKSTQPTPTPKLSIPPSSDSGSKKEKDTAFAAPKRVGSWGRPKTPKPPGDGTLSRTGSDLKPTTPTLVIPPTSPFVAVKNVIRRSRSKTDFGRSSTPGLKELMTQYGGPPVVSINSPTPDTNSLLPPSFDTFKRPVTSDGANNRDSVFMDLAVRSDPIIPTLDGFRDQVRQLNPRIPEYLLERLRQEQHKRFKRLLQLKIDHLKSVRNGKCSSGALCFALGGKARLLPLKSSGKDSDTPQVGFQIMQPGMTEEDLAAANDGSMIPASFPAGIPLPPVPSLPAEFECPLCFKVKKFAKPSDWTKHVREDAQPFTCTFPSCSEPRSFSRKADWVRHESERHRQLESWTCNIQGCLHTCYRRDNFVQHLDREHKLPVIRVRLSKAQGSKSPNTPMESMNWDRALAGEGEMSADVTAIIDQCHHKTSKDPKQEPCKFCNNILSDWKKLEVHLSKHMEQISLPVLRLVEQRKVDADTKLSPLEAPSRSLLAVSPMSAVSGGSMFLSDEPATYDTSPISGRLTPSSTFPPVVDNGFLHHDLTAATAANTYPPPQMAPRKLSAASNGQLAPPQNYPYQSQDNSPLTYSSHSLNVSPPAMAHNRMPSSFPPPSLPAGSSPLSINGLQSYSPHSQLTGTTYPPLLDIPQQQYPQQQGQSYDSGLNANLQGYGQQSTDLTPTYLQQGPFSGSPTTSLFEQAGVCAPVNATGINGSGVVNGGVGGEQYGQSGYYGDYRG